MQAELKQENPMVEGVIWRQMLNFFFPILLGTFFQQMYNTADALIVGRILGESALAAVGGSAGIITMTVVGFFMGLSSGAAIIAAQMMGAKDRNQVNDSIHTIYGFALAAGIAGLTLSYYLGASAGAAISLILALTFAVSFSLRKRRA